MPGASMRFSAMETSISNIMVSAGTLLIKRVEEGKTIEINHLLEALEEFVIQQARKSG